MKSKSKERRKGDSELSAREKEIVKLLASGYSTRDIASGLELSDETVKTHRKNIHRKLRTHSVVELIIKVRDLKLA
jgi:DNA-binding CsgD family transcriptional regulator